MIHEGAGLPGSRRDVPDAVLLPAALVRNIAREPVSNPAALSHSMPGTCQPGARAVEDAHAAVLTRPPRATSAELNSLPRPHTSTDEIVADSSPVRPRYAFVLCYACHVGQILPVQISNNGMRYVRCPEPGCTSDTQYARDRKRRWIDG